MRVKGTTVKSIQSFVKEKWPQRYDEWLNSLPQSSKDIMSDAIYATNWYPLNEGAVIPTYTIKMFFEDNSLKAAVESGKYNAEATLTGVYKIFVKMSNPGYIIKRASKIMSTYYEDTLLEVGETTSNSVILDITKFEQLDKMIEYRISGWIEKALELSGCKDINVRISLSMTKGDSITRYFVTWK